jgi:chemotaxis family two-component system response regulator Rcp1
MTKTSEILLIDDNPQDNMIFRNFLQRNNPEVNLNIMQNYVDAIEYLFSVSSIGDHIMPHLILLEITTSTHKGLRLLKSIKEHPELKKIPLLVLTNSKNPEDVDNCYNLYANAFIRKPESKERYRALIRTIIKFWINTVSLPEHTWS